MPWEIDYALLTFIQLKKSKYHLPQNVNIIIDSVLNDFDFATELNYVLSGLCSLVILWHFSS